MAAVASGRLRSGTRFWTPEALTPGRGLPPRTVEAAADALVDALAEAEARPGGREAGRPGGREAGRPGGREAGTGQLHHTY